MLHSILPEDLAMLLNNQEICKKDAPVTTRATFKLTQLKLLIEAIEKEYKVDGSNEDREHNICVTFVREDLDKIILYGNAVDAKTKLEKYKTEHDNRKFSQLIPIITGCTHILNSDKDSGDFKYMTFNGAIPCVRSGGEGTGLIPPPPTVGDDTSGAI